MVFRKSTQALESKKSECELSWAGHFNSSESQLPCLYNGAMTMRPPWAPWGLNEVVCVECLAHGKCS